ncbi:hypothetical protein B0T22DRAFT_68017 [Podospora appendiculata]|uniref:Zn(2)-C6 fungal-type domain-containing protein n=1 Tax=Podospora appendiculata TaxID=314037 RepID=A0AAE0XJG4_9PEZI|nr:hypothetical protein B0T22DRAFT_68017 [Podospora appendiculata]
MTTEAAAMAMDTASLDPRLRDPSEKKTTVATTPVTPTPAPATATATTSTGSAVPVPVAVPLPAAATTTTPSTSTTGPQLHHPNYTNHPQFQSRSQPEPQPQPHYARAQTQTQTQAQGQGQAHAQAPGGGMQMQGGSRLGPEKGAGIGIGGSTIGTAAATATATATAAAAAASTTATTPYVAPGSSFSPQTANSGSHTSTPVNDSHYHPGGEPVTPGADGHGDPNGDPNGDSKKPRACESCRGLKVRCEPDPANPEGPCKRCAKAGRACIVTQPTRKRQKKTDNRVAELEKKIDALTASLHATRGGIPLPLGAPAVPHTVVSPIATAAPAPTGHDPHGTRDISGSLSGSLSGSISGDGRPPGAVAVAVAGSLGRDENPGAVSGLNSHTSPPLSREWPPRDQPAAGRKHGHLMQPTYAAPWYGGMDMDASASPRSLPIPSAGQKRKFSQAKEAVSEETAPPASFEIEGLQPRADVALERSLEVTVERPPDVVDRGIISMVQAAELLVRYNEHMAPHLPGVVFSANTTAAELRRSKPILFLSIMAAASSEMPTIQRSLTKELMQVFADKVIVVGHKSLELVQAIQVAVIWYWPPEHFEELKFYQLLHIAAVMAIDLGLGRKKQARGGFRKHIPPAWGDHPLRKNAPPDPTTIEARRAWLTCYFLATNTSMALHRPNLIRWTPFMAECVDILETSPDAAPTDRYFCHLIWTHKLAEEVGIQFSMDDPASTPNISDSRTQYALRGFERELEKYSDSIPQDMQQPSLRLSFHVLSLYMHEIATQSEFSEEPKQPFMTDSSREADAPLTPAHIKALSACLTAIDGIFEVFLSLDIHSIRCLPVFNFVRVAYAVVVLIKMYFAASSPKSELGKVINKDNMKVEQHLEKLLEKFRITAANERSRPAAKFLVVLIMLRSWFQKQNQTGGSPYPSSTCAGTGTGTGAASSVTVPHESTSASPAPCGQRRDSGETKDNIPQPHRSGFSSSANTPLQLLSEIATNNSVGTTPRTNNSDLLSASNGPNSWLGRPPPPQPFIYDPAAGGSSADGSGLGNAEFPLPWLSGAFNSDFDYANLALGDGFAQAMDLTLGGLAADGGLGMGYILPEQQAATWYSIGTQLDGMNPGSEMGAGGYPF